MSKRVKKSLPAPNSATFNSAVKDIIELREGVRSGWEPAFVTFKDLKDYDWSSILGQTNDPGPIIIPGDPPEPPTNLVVTEGMLGNKLTWTKSVSGNVWYYQVWVSPTQNRGDENAGVVAVVPHPIEEYWHNLDAVNAALDHYYWIRAISWSGEYSTWEPSDAQGGYYMPGATTIQERIDDALAVLSEQITESELYQDLIEKIETPLYDSTLAPVYDSSTTYDVGDHVRYEYDTNNHLWGLYRCKYNGTTNKVPTLTFYWTKTLSISERIELAEGDISTLDGQVSTLEIDVGNIETTLSPGGDIYTMISNRLEITTYNTDQYDGGNLRISVAENNISNIQDSLDVGGSIYTMITDRLEITTYNTDQYDGETLRISTAESEISNIQESLDVGGAIYTAIINRLTINTYETEQYENEVLRISTAENTISNIQTSLGPGGDIYIMITDRLTITTYELDQYDGETLRIDAAEQTLSLVSEDMDDVKAEWTVKLNVNNRVAGVGLMLGSSQPSEFIILVDKFKIVNPNNDLDVAQVFIVDTVSGTVGIDGNLVVDGTILAQALDVSELSAITANLGTVNITSGKGLTVEKGGGITIVNLDNTNPGKLIFQDKQSPTDKEYHIYGYYYNYGGTNYSNLYIEAQSSVTTQLVIKEFTNILTGTITTPLQKNESYAAYHNLYGYYSGLQAGLKVEAVTSTTGGVTAYGKGGAGTAGVFGVRLNTETGDLCFSVLPDKSTKVYGHFVPSADNTIDIGTSSYAFKDIYARTIQAPAGALNIGSNVTFQGTIIPDTNGTRNIGDGSHAIGMAYLNTILPNEDGTKNIGTSAFAYANLYVQAINNPNGVLSLNDDVNVTGTFEVDGASTFNAQVTLEYSAPIIELIDTGEVTPKKWYLVNDNTHVSLREDTIGGEDIMYKFQTAGDFWAYGDVSGATITDRSASIELVETDDVWAMAQSMKAAFDSHDITRLDKKLQAKTKDQAGKDVVGKRPSDLIQVLTECILDINERLKLLESK